ncbi:MAG TPA: hypothetical protein VGE29_03920 [Prosthecobacter sp.]
MKMEQLVKSCFQVLRHDLVSGNFAQSDFSPDEIQAIAPLLPHGFLSKAGSTIGFTSTSAAEHQYLIIFPLEHGLTKDHSQWKTSPPLCVIMFSRSHPSEAAVYGYHTSYLPSPVPRGFTASTISEQAKRLFNPRSKVASPTLAFRAISHLADVMREEMNENAGRIKFH